MEKGGSQRQDHEDGHKTRPAFIRNTQGSEMRNGGCFPRVSITKNARGWGFEEKRERKGARTYVDVPFNVPNEDEVTRTGVADVGVNGD